MAARRGFHLSSSRIKCAGRHGSAWACHHRSPFSAFTVIGPARHAGPAWTVYRHRNKRAIMGAQWKVKHKEAAANAKGRIFGKLSKEIMIAARSGADPDMNARLRLVVEQAKKASMPRET